MSSLDDPRVFFSAERTALAWNRTALTLMAFGFAVERFGLYMHMMEKNGATPPASDGHLDGATPSFWFGIVFVALGCFFSIAAAQQYKGVLKTLKPVEIPQHAKPMMAFFLNIAIALAAAVLVIYLTAAHLL